MKNEEITVRLQQYDTLHKTKKGKENTRPESVSSPEFIFGYQRTPTYLFIGL